MENKERVVVVAPLERKVSTDKVHCARIRALGLTAYGGTAKESQEALKRMFATYVELHRRSGTLEERLNKSKLCWCYESDYCGNKPAELLTADGSTQIIQGKENSDKENSWMGAEPELILAT